MRQHKSLLIEEKFKRRNFIHNENQELNWNSIRIFSVIINNLLLSLTPAIHDLLMKIFLFSFSIWKALKFSFFATHATHKHFFFSSNNKTIYYAHLTSSIARLPYRVFMVTTTIFDTDTALTMLLVKWCFYKYLFPQCHSNCCGYMRKYT